MCHLIWWFRGGNGKFDSNVWIWSYIYIYESFVRNREAPFHGSRTRFNDALKVDVGVNMFIWKIGFYAHDEIVRSLNCYKRWGIFFKKKFEWKLDKCFLIYYMNYYEHEIFISLDKGVAIKTANFQIPNQILNGKLQNWYMKNLIQVLCFKTCFK